MEIAQILLENGARDEWGDLSGTYARDYIRDDEIGVLFKKHGFSLNYNYETKKYEPDTIRKEIQPTQRGKAISFSSKKKRHKQQLLMNLNQAHPELFHLTPAQDINFAYHQLQLMSLNQDHQELKDHA